MRTRIKVTDLTEAQWYFVGRFVGTEYPLDGTAVQVTYEYATTTEFTTVMPVSKFNEVQGHLARLAATGTPYIDPDDQDDWERENPVQVGGVERLDALVKADQARMREMLSLIQGMIDTVDGMRSDLREFTGRAETPTTYPKELHQ